MSTHYDESTPSPHSNARRRRSLSPSAPSAVKKQRYSPAGPGKPLAHTNGLGMSAQLQPLSLSILGVEPLDEFIREVADWVHDIIMSRPPMGGVFEVEAKLGLLKYRDDNVRLKHPVRVETILQGDDHRFESNMSAAQHKHFNTMLNRLEASSRQPDHPTSPLRYTHLHLVDSFFSDGSEKVRVTRDERTGEVKECLRKIRLGDLDVYSPKRDADWRVSVNLEIPVSHPLGSPSFTRKKDRMSYSHEEFNIDLTQVTQSSGPTGQPQVMHELEVELARPAILMSTASVRGDPSVSPAERDAFDELIRAFVNNVRILVRNARPS